MKSKKHCFVVTVTTTKSKKSARISVLTAFASRKPDGCEFSVAEIGSFLRRSEARVAKALGGALPETVRHYK